MGWLYYIDWSFRNFSIFIAAIIECLKKCTFDWSKNTQGAFETMNTKLSKAPVLALQDFEQVFEVEYDASGVGNGAVIFQNKHLIA